MAKLKDILTWSLIILLITGIIVFFYYTQWWGVLVLCVGTIIQLVLGKIFKD